MLHHGPLARYVKLRVVHAPRMPGTFSPPPRVSVPGMYHGTCATQVSWCMPGSLTSGVLWSRWRGNHSRHSQRMRNPQFYVSGKRSMDQTDPGWSKRGLGPVLFLRSDAVASLLINDSVAFQWNLHCHWLIGLQQFDIAEVIHGPVSVILITGLLCVKEPPVM